MGRLEEVNAELSALREGLSRRKALTAKLDDLRDQRRALSDKATELYEVFAREQEDVDKLERLSFTSILQSLMGEKEQRLRKERQEALTAKLKYDAAKASLQDVDERMSASNSELSALNAEAQRYQALLEEKAGLLTDPADAERIRHLEERIARCDGVIREADEAIRAGRAVDGALSYAGDELDSAEDWGVWDMLGGGTITTAIKRSHIDEAMDSAYEAQLLMSRFRTELADVKESIDLTLEDDGLAFADYFFDGLIADWFVQQGIEESAQSVANNRYKIQEVLSRLERLRREAEDDRGQAHEELRGIVEQA